MARIFTSMVPLIAACAGVFIVFRLFKRATCRMPWVSLLRYVIGPAAFFPIFLATSAFTVTLVSGDVLHTYVFDGSRGPAIWQVNAVLIWSHEEDVLERRRLDIIDRDTGRRLVRHDYVRWGALPIEVEVLGEGREFVWLYSAEQGLHIRDIYDGRWLRGQKELLGGIEVANAQSFSHDSASRGLFVTARAGKRWFLDPRSLRLVATGAAEDAPNRFAARLDRDVTIPTGRRFQIGDGGLQRLAEGRLEWERLGDAQFRDAYFVISESLQAELPDTFFIEEPGSLSRVQQDGRVRWTQRNVLDSSKRSIDYAFPYQGRLCLLSGNRLPCFSLKDGSVQWVIR